MTKNNVITLLLSNPTYIQTSKGTFLYVLIGQLATDGYPDTIHPTETRNLFGFYWNCYFPRGIFEVSFLSLKLELISSEA